MQTYLTDQDLYHLLINRTTTAMNRKLQHNLNQNHFKLTKEQWSILAVLWKKDGCSQQYLADETYRDKPSITRLLDNMEKEQLIVRIPDYTDRRTNLIYLTTKSKKMEAEVKETVCKTIDQALQNIEPENVLIMKDTLERIFENLH
ncbi:MarR family winged helix-turn-helix transcriptional regulator [Flavobacterium sp. '19STA2R22 D10 B1']|uniref:MarR family winged helix-turn-helix transcriptional regulator n=1 Tax=Flavobacterium aerium TaxID=3037261 RepID=UPI00278C260D|nr:MarR family transcriptional regulator [Flavobacterium sp. '19STA2R22 D10 B1']